MDLFLHDLRLAVRTFLRRPGLTLVAIAALTLGIGANVAIFSVFYGVLLRPLPFLEPERLVAIWEKNPDRGWHQAQVAAANYLDWEEQAGSFEGIAAHNDWMDELSLLVDGEPVRVRGPRVTGNFFEVLGVAPILGPGLDDRHTWSTAEPAVVLSHAFWQRRFGGDAGVVGRELALDGESRTVLGIMPEGFDYPFRDADLWLPTAWNPENRQQVWFRRAHGMSAIGRLAGRVSLAEAKAELAAIAARLEAGYPETNTRMGAGVTPLHEWVVGDTRRPLQILMTAVGFVLLIACANVANLLLVRAASRRQEMAVRHALGGGRWRLVAQGLTESILLAITGGALGLIAGISSIGPLLAMSPDGLPRIEEISVSGPLILFTVGISLLTGLVFGAAPAWRAAGVDPAASRALGRRGASPGRRGSRSASALVAAEVALTLPLVVGAGLVVRTLWELSRIEPGFVADDVLVASVSLPSSRYADGPEITGFYRSLVESVAALPGVESAAMSSRLPFGNQRWSSDFTAEGWADDGYGIGVRHDEVTPGLFDTMGVPLLRGRDFELGDGLDPPYVVIVNQALADRYFPDEDPIGRRVTFDRVPSEDSAWRTIVGVVGNVRRERLALEEKPSFYAPVLQDWTRGMNLLVKTERDPRAMTEAIRQGVRVLDPALPLFDVTTLEELVSRSLAQERFLLVLLGIFAGVALLLACVGIFGVVFHSTTRRTREIGIRMALGARGSAVIGLVFRRGLVPVVAGIAVGLAVAALLVRGLSAMLFEVEALDPLTFGAVVGILLLAALLACALPARWATRVDAVAALRSE